MIPKIFRKIDVFLFLLFAATLHILLTHLVSNHVGREMGLQIADFISSTSINQVASEKELQNIPSSFEKNSKILFLLSLPFGPIFKPIYKQWAVKPALERKIQIDEYNFRAKLIGITTRVLNSIVFSLLVYWCFRTVLLLRKQNRMHKNV